MFKNKTILITGGTGSFGHSFLKRLLKLKTPPKEIRILAETKKSKMI